MSERLFQKFHGNMSVELEDDSYFWGNYYWGNRLRVFWFYNNYIHSCDGCELIPSEKIIFYNKINKPNK